MNKTLVFKHRTLKNLFIQENKKENNNNNNLSIFIFKSSHCLEKNG